MNETYRLLRIGEKVLPTDEIFDIEKGRLAPTDHRDFIERCWFPMSTRFKKSEMEGLEMHAYSFPIRRRMEYTLDEFVNRFYEIGKEAFDCGMTSSPDDILDLVQKPISGQDWEKASVAIGVSRSKFFEFKKLLIADKRVTQTPGTKLFVKV